RSMVAYCVIELALNSNWGLIIYNEYAPCSLLDSPYGSGSGQQSVTGFPGLVDSNSYWIVKPVPKRSAKQGDAIENGETVRLQHMKTRKWLHSHLHASPISGNFEISCFGDDSNSDTGDHWKLVIEGSGKTWEQDQRVRLQHIDTSGYLHSHDKKYQRIAGDHQEVCGVREKRVDNVWLAAEGVYLPLNESSNGIRARISPTIFKACTTMGDRLASEAHIESLKVELATLNTLMAEMVTTITALLGQIANAMQRGGGNAGQRGWRKNSRQL
ncbi:unnamed protein product, partial [Cochlearia groenlandica]